MEKIKLLVFIDDDYATNFYHKIIVRDSRLVENCMFFSEPEKALKYFENLSKEENGLIPDAIFLDINMPKMNGWEFLENYAQIAVAKSPIIFMLSTSVYPEDEQRAANNPLVNGFKNKPLTKDHLEELKQELQMLC